MYLAVSPVPLATSRRLSLCIIISWRVSLVWRHVTYLTPIPITAIVATPRLPTEFVFKCNPFPLPLSLALFPSRSPPPYPFPSACWHCLTNNTNHNMHMKSKLLLVSVLHLLLSSSYKKGYRWNMPLLVPDADFFVLLKRLLMEQATARVGWCNITITEQAGT